MNKAFLTTGALLAAVAVIFGAFGAHFLKSRLEISALQIFETGVRYQFYHALGLLLAGMLYKEFPGKLMQWAGRFFVAGIILFSGSLYLLCIMSAMRWLGAITPLGGLCFISGWILLAMAFKRAK